MSATVEVYPVFTNGATGDLRVTVTSTEFGDSLTGYIDAASVIRQASRALSLDDVTDASAARNLVAQALEDAANSASEDGLASALEVIYDLRVRAKEARSQ